ncbi:MAG: ABC transporter permease [Bacteroidales bacterium]
MRSLVKIMKGEMSIISKEFAIIMTLFLGPIVYAFFVGSVYEKKNIQETPMGIVDLDGTETSRTLTRFVDASPKAHISESFSNYEDALTALNSFDNYGFLYIPNGFEKNLKKGKGGTIMAYLNTTRFLPANELLQAINEVSMTMGAGVRIKYFTAKGLPLEGAKNKALPIQPVIRTLYNPAISYGDFLLPAVFLLILHQTLFMGIGQSISLTKERYKIGVLKDLSGGSALKAILGKSAFYYFLYLAYSLLFCGVIFQVFDVPMRGSFGILFFMFLIFVFTISNFGLLMGSFFRTQSFWMIFVAFTSYPFFLSTGYSWPLSEMPEIIQWMAAILPSTPFFLAMQQIVTMGADFASVQGHILHMLGLSLVIFVLTWWRMQYLFKKEVSDS